MPAVIRTSPHLTRPVWAGPALSERFGKPPGPPDVGESWEVWRDNRVVGGEHVGARLADVVDFPLLIKLLSTRDVLSVQVHPDDATARRHGAASGKAEAWVVLDAEPDGRVAVGLRDRVPTARLRELALTGEIEQHLAWFPVRAGDVIDVPPGTIHAIGGGVTLYEVQQPADITWRLYDWGRGRELHLDAALEIADPGPAAGPRRPTGRLVDHPLFVVERGVDPEQGRTPADRWRAVTCVSGRVEVAGEPLVPGDTVMVGPGDAVVDGPGEALVAWLP